MNPPKNKKIECGRWRARGYLGGVNLSVMASSRGLRYTHAPVRLSPPPRAGATPRLTCLHTGMQMHGGAARRSRSADTRQAAPASACSAPPHTHCTVLGGNTQCTTLHATALSQSRPAGVQACARTRMQAHSLHGPACLCCACAHDNSGGDPAWKARAHRLRQRKRWPVSAARLHNCMQARGT